VCEREKTRETEREKGAERHWSRERAIERWIKRERERSKPDGVLLGLDAN